jgi:hypothetical protein
MLTFDDDNPALQIFLTYPAGGGTLYTGGFGSSSVGSYFSPTCGGEICGFPLDGTVTAASGVSTTPLPAALPLFAGGLGMIGFISRRRKQKTITLAA